jgi:hypothetical protein
MRFFILFVILLISSIIFCNPFKEYWFAEVKSEKYSSKVYINCIGLGATGDHRIIKISPRKDKSTERKTDEYYLNAFCNIFYKPTDDTLFIYTEESFGNPTREGIKLPIVIKQIDIKDYQNGKYNCLGLIQISPYATGQGKK